MSGRFFVAPLLCAVIIIAWSAPDNMRTLSRIIILAMVLTTGLLAEIPTFRLLPSQTQQITDSHGITDERVWYYSDFALFSPERNNDLSLTAGKNGAKARAEAGDDLYVIAVNNTGVFGFYAGPYVYVVDQLALSEPLLARLPAIQKVNWRIGHFTRLLPAGYISAIYGLGKLDDEGLAQYYEKLHLITSGKLSDPQRLVEIWRINTGYYDSLIDYDAYRYPDMVRTTLTEMKDLTTKSQGTQHAVGSRLYFYDSGIDIDLNAEYHFGQYSLCLDSDDDYRIQYLNETGIVASQDHPKTSDTSTMKCQQVNIPSKAIRNGFTHIRIFPDAGNGDYSTGGLDLIDINP